MSEQSVATHVLTDEGELEFQRYFVARRCQPVVRAIRFAGADAATPAPGVEDAIAAADIILIAPSNPFLSVDPLLAVPGIRAALGRARAPIVAVSPIIGGQAVKGPTAKLMDEMGLVVGNDAIARHYAGLVDGLLIDRGDPPPAGAIACARTDTMMRTVEDKRRVAQAAIDLARSIASA